MNIEVGEGRSGRNVGLGGVVGWNKGEGGGRGEGGECWGRGRGDGVAMF